MSPNPPKKEFTRKDFSSDQEVRWCPGCGDYAILAAVQRTLPKLGSTPENTVFISGIGCSSHCDGPQARQSRARHLGRDRRRRRAQHRWQPSAARAAAQHRPADPAVQQSDLRSHEGPIFTDLAGRHHHPFQPARLDRPTGRPGAFCPGGACYLRGAILRYLEKPSSYAHYGA